MGLKDGMATVGAWGWFGANLLVFDPILRVSSLVGPRSLERAAAVMCHSLAFSVRTGMCELRLHGQENIPPNGRVIVICNHQSLVESFVPFWLLETLRPKFVAKKVMGKWIPAVSFVLRRGGSCLIDRHNHVQALAAIADLGKRVHAGDASAMIFPEGTRSTVGKLGKFRPTGLVTLMRQAPNAAILPMVVHGGDRVFPKGRPRVQAGSVVDVSFLPLITPAELGRVAGTADWNGGPVGDVSAVVPGEGELKVVEHLYAVLNEEFAALAAKKA